MGEQHETVLRNGRKPDSAGLWKRVGELCVLFKRQCGDVLFTKMTLASECQGRRLGRQLGSCLGVQAEGAQWLGLPWSRRGG